MDWFLIGCGDHVDRVLSVDGVLKGSGLMRAMMGLLIPEFDRLVQCFG